MKELQKVILTILLVCSSLVAMAAADPTMSVSEQPAGIAIGETFTAEVTVDPAGAEIYAAQCDLYFDHTILKATEQTQGTFLSQGDAIVKEVVNTIDNTAGKIEYGETRFGDPETVGGATATGFLASITFEVIGEGVSTLTLGDMMCVTPDDLRDPEPTSDPTSDNADDENPDVSSDGSSWIQSTKPTATLTKTPTESVTLSGDSSDAMEDHNATPVSSGAGSTMADSIPPSSKSLSITTPAETPLRPESAIPGFAAPLMIVGLLAVVIMLKSRGE